ncbi:MAG TPA: rhodanese-like domain-containing protein [Verrucomicrobiae bacterium]|nr:rhodanese-like domain-containing protein [Verrucomicrobiae bacterium]
MNWPTWIIIGGAIAAFLVLKRLALVSPEVAREWLKRGGKVIDVRSEAEFQEKHLPGVLNIPLHCLRDQIGRHAPGKEQAILLHCLSGGRSGIGKSALRKMGYRNAFNLGSYGRAQKILAG